MSSKTALFASVVLALAGANLLQVWSFLSAYLFTDTLPDTALFAVAFWIWFATAIGAAWCGLRGGYTLVRRGTIRAWTLTTFAGMSCLLVKVGSTELGYSAVRLGLSFGVPDFRIGVNVLGVGLLWWLQILRQVRLRRLPTWNDSLLKAAAPSNQRMKLSCRSGHDWWNTRGRPSFFVVAAPARSLCAIR
jgi:hypothetical protein